MLIPKMDPAKAMKVKRELRESAGKGSSPVDLSDPNNKYTLWDENGIQGYVCASKGPDKGTVYRDLWTVGSGATVLAVGHHGDEVTIWTCEVG